MQAHLNRRRFVASLAAVATSTAALATIEGCAPLADRPRERVPLIGYLATGFADSPGTVARSSALRAGLREQRLVEGRDLSIAFRYDEGQNERLPALAAELLALGVRLIVTSGPTPTVAARSATDQVPIVMLGGPDPVAVGWAASLARPGGNITGTTHPGPALFAKSVQLLAAVAPAARRLGSFMNLSILGEDLAQSAMATAAEQLGLQFLVLDVRTHAEIEPAFERARAWGIDAAAIRNLPPFNSPTRAPVLTQVAGSRLPAISWNRFWVDEGLLMMHMSSDRELGSRAAPHVARILSGANAGNLPIYRTTEFELLINRTTLTNLGLSVPTDVEAQVTEWIA